MQSTMKKWAEIGLLGLVSFSLVSCKMGTLAKSSSIGKIGSTNGLVTRIVTLVAEEFGVCVLEGPLNKNDLERLHQEGDTSEYTPVHDHVVSLPILQAHVSDLDPAAGTLLKDALHSIAAGMLITSGAAVFLKPGPDDTEKLVGSIYGTPSPSLPPRSPIKPEALLLAFTETDTSPEVRKLIEMQHFALARMLEIGNNHFLHQEYLKEALAGTLELNRNQKEFLSRAIKNPEQRETLTEFLAWVSDQKKSNLKATSVLDEFATASPANADKLEFLKGEAIFLNKVISKADNAAFKQNAGALGSAVFSQVEIRNNMQKISTDAGTLHRHALAVMNDYTRVALDTQILKAVAMANNDLKKMLTNAERSLGELKRTQFLNPTFLQSDQKRALQILKNHLELTANEGESVLLKRAGTLRNMAQFDLPSVQNPDDKLTQEWHRLDELRGAFEAADPPPSTFQDLLGKAGRHLDLRQCLGTTVRRMWVQCTAAAATVVWGATQTTRALRSEGENQARSEALDPDNKGLVMLDSTAYNILKKQLAGMVNLDTDDPVPCGQAATGATDDAGTTGASDAGTTGASDAGDAGAAEPLTAVPDPTGPAEGKTDLAAPFAPN